METLPRTAPTPEPGRETKPHRACDLSSCGSGKTRSRRHASNWRRSMPNSSKRWDAARPTGAPAPPPVM
ncbi:hypothetical protein C2845_PM10G11760 [Panicum miliaceum]|uniref:Uncharacterized protein n=1 Tax=Panicum miliaceum TaxID=4540 RepID=A0A3L6PDH7_PANMI|nr:hypothetical protein C2845_PM10G11760 [Panicum miliaceum]